MNRAKALEMGITEENVASSLLTSLSGNSLLTPNFWVDPKNAVNCSDPLPQGQFDRRDRQHPSKHSE